MLTHIISQISEERKRKLYVFLSRSPVVSLLMKSYVQRTSPVWHVLYKKTGRTWLRVMLGKALQLHFEIDEADDTLLYFARIKSFLFRELSFFMTISPTGKSPRS